MNAPLAPLRFRPVYQSYVWGGNRLATAFGRAGAPAPCAESWELSGHADGPSVVAGGAFDGRTLADLARAYGAALTGARAPDPARFPLLIKLIDARDRLSVQVHPNNANAVLTRGEPKSEAWLVLDRTPGAGLYAGLADGVGPDTLAASLADGTAESALVRLPVEPGQALYIPGGLVHAIGAGCLVYEVQQASNTTYRLFDWNRTGADGQPRALHVGESFKTIDWTLRPPRMRPPETLGRSGANVWSSLVACPYFTLRQLALAEPQRVPVSGASFHALFVREGRATVTSGGETAALAAGDSCLIPADSPGYTLAPAPSASVLLTTL